MSDQTAQQMSREELIEQILSLSESLKISKKKEQEIRKKVLEEMEKLETAERKCEQAEIENQMQNVLS
ncbi:hypothetical protein IPN35_00410 [Candidatus Peregrinibacteria bacterium]|nr:MAG: hypothetical protein IPN35_00410 [Candidatus Peregrinibacteria bacterium]